MRYIDADGHTAKITNPTPNSLGYITVVIDDSDKQDMMPYDEFIARFNAIVRDSSTSLSAR